MKNKCEMFEKLFVCNTVDYVFLLSEIVNFKADNYEKQNSNYAQFI